MSPTPTVGSLQAASQRLVAAFAPPTGDRVLDRRASAVVLGSVLGAACLGLAGVVRGLLHGLDAVSAVSVVSASLMASAPYVLRWTRRPQLAGALTPVVMVLHLGLVALDDGRGLAAMSVFAFPLLPVLAQALMGGASGSVFACLASVQAAVLAWLHAGEGASSWLVDSRLLAVAAVCFVAAEVARFSDAQHERLLRQNDQAVMRQRSLLSLVPDVAVRVDRDGVVQQAHGGDRGAPTAIASLMRPGASVACLSADVARTVRQDVQRVLSNGRLSTRAVSIWEHSNQRAFEVRYAPSGRDEVTLLFREVTDLRALARGSRVQGVLPVESGVVSVPALMTAVEDAVQLAAAGGEPCALLLVDLGALNEAGSPETEQVIAELSSRIVHVVRPRDLVARHGVDELVVLLRSVAAPHIPTDVAQRVLDVAARPMIVAGGLREVFVTVGVAACPADARSADTLLERADEALFAARRMGRSTALRFHRGLRREDSEVRAL